MAEVGCVVIHWGWLTNPATVPNASGNREAGDRYRENPGKAKPIESLDCVSLQKSLLNWEKSSTLEKYV